MKKIFLDCTRGPIGVEAYDTKVLLHFADYFKKNGLEPIIIYTCQSHNKTLNRLSKRKFSQSGIKYISIPNNRFFNAFYYKTIFRRVMSCKFYRDIFKDNKRIMLDSSQKYADYLINNKKSFAKFDNTPFAFEALNNKEKHLFFTQQENEFAAGELKKIGISGDFICVHARDSAYYAQEAHKRVQRDNSKCPRNMELEDFLLACRYLQENGLQTLRMGAVQNAVKKEFFNDFIIDYATKHRTDFMDIWLIANCKFYLGSCSGLFAVACLFNKPVAIANCVPLLIGVPAGANDIYLPNKIWHKAQKRFLTYKEIAKYDIGLEGWELSQRYEKEGLENVKNSPEEILDLAKEMHEVINKEYQYTQEDNYLQDRFRSVFRNYHAPYHTPARAGREFLRQNKELFI